MKVVADSDYGLPYGHYPRLLLSWATTEAVRTKSREIMLGDSLRDFMERLGISPGGRQAVILKGHMRRLFTSDIHATYIKDGEEYFRRLHPIDDAVILWDPKRPGQTSLWKSAEQMIRSSTHRTRALHTPPASSKSGGRKTISSTQ